METFQHIFFFTVVEPRVITQREPSSNPMYLDLEGNLLDEIENISNQTMEGMNANWTNLFNIQSEQLDASQDPVGSSPMLTKIRGQLLENHKIKFHGKI